MSDFVRSLCSDHAEWLSDLTLGGSPPLGWRPLVRAAFEGMRITMADDPRARVSLVRLEATGDRLCVEVHDDAQRPTPIMVLLALEGIIAEVVRVSSEPAPSAAGTSVLEREMTAA